MRFFKSVLAGLALFGLSACDAPSSGASAEPLRDAALRDRIADHQIVLIGPDGRKRVTMTYNADGTGLRLFSPGGPRETFTWDVQGNQICAGLNAANWQCASAAVSGDNITMRFEGRRTGQTRTLAGKLVPV